MKALEGCLVFQGVLRGSRAHSLESKGLSKNYPSQLAPTLRRGSKSWRSSVTKPGRRSGQGGVPTLERGNEQN